MKIFFTFTILVGFLFLLYCCVETTKPDTQAEAVYVGSTKCQHCHANEYANYTESDHFHAMDSALPRSVKGNFNNSQFIYHGDTARFYQKDEGYFVYTKDSTGKPTEFRVSFSFGWQPLQQYLVQFADGRIQTLPYCWDTRPKEKGGQRWFHIYGQDKILPGDELYWTDINQNWNNMCADCHTTDYKKNYAISTNTFHSSWGEANVSCESCHGPASGHLNWVENKSMADSLKGFVFNLAGKKKAWSMNSAKGIAFPDDKTPNNVQIETCARCHSRSTRLSDNYYHGQSLLQTHIPSTINTVNYFIDGQIKEEDYEYGSFLQSKMYANGVTCINCHDAHSMKLKGPGNSTCNSCHSPEKFNTADHTHHPENSIGASCANCHMPVTTYMSVDDRRDHSIRIPRPDLSLVMGTPNACNKCHIDKSVSWATRAFNKSYGNKLPENKTFGEHLFAISKNTEGSINNWTALLNSNNYPSIIKATTLDQYPDYLSQETIAERDKSLQNPDPNLRLNALRSFVSFPPEELLKRVKPFLNDPVLAVRTEVVSILAPQYLQFDVATKQRFDQVMNEYLTIQRNMSDRPEGYLNQGIVFGTIGRMSEAKQIYLLGLKRHPKFIALYANLADLYRSIGDEEKNLLYIQNGLKLDSSNASLHYALAMHYIRDKNMTLGLTALKKALQLAPGDASIAYTNAIALHTNGDTKNAILLLESFISKYGNHPQVIEGLISMSQNLQQTGQVIRWMATRKKMYGY
jgi:tetratricopeptide (TPR) repeat protein/nitrate/TMAO reductase-like tetraheme cytochrome c subunit